MGDLVYLVLLEGSNLNALVNGSVSLYDRGIQRHRVTWVREMTRQQVEKAGDGEVTIERIRILSHRPDEEPQRSRGWNHSRRGNRRSRWPCPAASAEC